MPIVNTVIPQTTINPADAYIAALASPTSRTTMRSRLNVVARMLGAADSSLIDWSTLSAASVAAIIGSMSGSAATKNQTLAALKGVARTAWRIGMMSTDDLQRIRDVGAVRGSRVLAGRDIERDDLRKLLSVCKGDSSPAGARDAAMFALAASCGLRRIELAALTIANIHEDRGDEVEIRFIGKGNKERSAYVFNGALKAFRAWLSVRGTAGGALFCAINRGSVIDVEHQLSAVALHKIFHKRTAQAGIDSDISLHDLRRTWVGDLLDKGVDIVTVAQLAGHADVRTTQRYDRRPNAIRRAAAARVQVPY